MRSTPLKEENRLHIRVAQPVVGCTVEPFAVFRSATDESHHLTFAWYRQPSRGSCGFSLCPQRDAPNGGLKSKSPVQCLQCLSAARAKGGSAEVPTLAYFCSPECFAKGYREHAQFHASVSNSEGAVLRNGPAWESQLALLAEQPSALQSRDLSSLFAAADLSDSRGSAEVLNAGAPRAYVAGASDVLLSREAAYKPSWADAGHMLRLEVTASSGRPPLENTPDAAPVAALLHQSVLVGPVLSSPPLLRPPGWVLAPGVPAALLRVLAHEARAGQSSEARVAGGGVEAARRALAAAREGGVRHWSGKRHSAAAAGGRAPDGPTRLGAGVVIRVLSWNVLAELYAGPGAYGHCPAWALAWPFRVRAIVADILRYDADIIALQEVQSEHFDSVISPAMAAAGYGALYKTKTREAAGTEGKIDGCAIFFRSSMFSVASTFVVEFNDVADALIAEERARGAPAQGQGQQGRHGGGRLSVSGPAAVAAGVESRMHVLAKRLRKDNVAQLAVLTVKDEGGGGGAPPQQLLVVNTHLHWDSARADVKLWQCQCLVREVERLVVTLSAAQGGAAAAPAAPAGASGGSLAAVLQEGAPQPFIPAAATAGAAPAVIFCGDLNSEPGSAVHSFLGGNWAAHQAASVAERAAAAEAERNAALGSGGERPPASRSGTALSAVVAAAANVAAAGAFQSGMAAAPAIPDAAAALAVLRAVDPAAGLHWQPPALTIDTLADALGRVSSGAAAAGAGGGGGRLVSGSQWLITRACLPATCVSALTGSGAVAFPVPRPAQRIDLCGAALPEDPAGILRSGGGHRDSEAPRGLSAGHDLLLASVHEAAAGAEPLYTNYTATYRGTLDYVWVDAARVRPLAVLRMPPPQAFAPHGLPGGEGDYLCGGCFRRASVRPLLLGGQGLLSSGAAAAALCALCASRASPSRADPLGLWPCAPAYGAPITAGRRRTGRWRDGGGPPEDADVEDAAALALVVRDAEGEGIALPSPYHPSDHLKVVCDLLVGCPAPLSPLFAQALLA